MLQKIFQLVAPSTRAASIRSRGSPMKKFRSRKIAERQREHGVRDPDPAVPPGQKVLLPGQHLPDVLELDQDRDERRLDGNDHQRDDDQEDRVPKREA